MDPEQVILSTAYLPPVQYFSKLIKYRRVIIETYETYPKQTYRNRCVILTANGPLPLVIPVLRPKGNRTLTKDIRIDNSVKWQREHWRAIGSAYMRSAFFELIRDELQIFYTHTWDYLIDYNEQLVQTICDILGVELLFEPTESFVMHYPSGMADYRYSIHPKPQYAEPDNDFSPLPYFQVFSDRFGFTPNLSVLDMLCNCGRDSLRMLSYSSTS